MHNSDPPDGPTGCKDLMLSLQWGQGECHPEYLDQPLVVERFEQAAAQYPDMPCVVFEGQEMSYAAVNAAASALAHRLAAAGAGPGSAVGVMLARSFELVVSVVAIWKAGCVYVPMDPDYPEGRLAIYAEDSQALLVLVHPSHEHKARSLISSINGTARTLVLERVELSASGHHKPAADGQNSRPKVQPSDLAYCIFTSSSTGRPKGVQVSHGALRDLLAHCAGLYKAGPAMRALQVVSISFDPHVLDITATITSGGCLVLPRPGGHMEPAYIAELIKQERVTHVLTSVPLLSAHYLTALGSYKDLQCWLTCGEPLSPELACQMQKAFPSLTGPHNGYGPPEATVFATNYCCPCPFEGPMVIVKPDHNMHCYVVDPTSLALLPPGAAGELLLSGPRLAAGYVGQPELTAKAFVPNPFFKSLVSKIPAALLPYYQRAYRTGDLVRWTSAGQLQFLGRIDRQVKVNGVRIELGEVEAALAGAPGVQGAVAKVVKDASGRASLVGYCLVAAEGVAAVQTHCRRVLLPTMVPSVILPLSEFPRLPNGKVDVDGLPEPDWAALAAGEEYHPPSNEVEVELHELWLEELKITDPISILAGLRKVPPLPLQCSDWAAWQSKFLASAEAQEQLQWWQQTLAGVPDLLALPTDRHRPAVQSFRGASYDFELPPDVAAAVAALNAATASSLYNTCLAAYKVVLSLYSGQHDIVVGSVHASRPPGTEGLIGYLVNTLPIRTTVSWDADVRHLLANERAALLDAMAHADVPFADVVAAVGIKRSSAYTPLVQATMTTADLDWLPHLSLPGCTPAACGVLPADGAEFDILLTIYPKGTDVAVSFQYNTDLFDSSTIMAMSETFTAVLAAAADRPDAPLSQLTAVVEKTQRKHLLCDLQGACHPEYLKSSLLHEAVTATAALDPGAPCLAFETSSMSYAEVEASANALASRLLATGMQPGARVGILLPRGLHLPVAMLAVLKAGGTYVPLDPYYPQDRLKYYVCAAGVSCIVADPMLVDRANDMVEAASQASAGGTRIALLQISHSEAVSAGLLEAVQPAVRVDPSSAAVIIFTSGSTGTPKGVMLSHRALMDFVQDWVARSKLGKADVGMLSSSICFDAHALQLWALLVAGGVCVVPRDEGHMDPKYIADLIAAHQITVNLFVTPQLGLEWLKHPAMKQNTGTVRLWGAGGELVPEQMLRLVDELFPGADNLVLYGPTETSVMVTCYAVPPSAPQGLLGQPTANSHLYVVFPGQPGSLVPIGAPGELLISGPGLADGYINLPDPAKTSFTDNPFYAEVSQFLPPALKPYYQRAYRTGDLVRWTSAGQLQFLGRIDRQVKVNGVRIELGEVEAALAGAPGVQGAVAKVVKDASGRASLVGYCLVAAEGVAAVQTHCRRVLLPTMVPSVIVALSEFPKLPNGKVNVAGLPEPDWAALAAGEEYQPPSNELEQELQELWIEELRISNPISVTTDWYRLGGTSLKAIALAAIIKQRYGLPAAASNLILLTTIAQQAQYVKQQLAAGLCNGYANLGSLIPVNEWPGDLRPSSAGQEQMYVLSMEGENRHYNEHSLYSIVGDLDSKVLHQALNATVKRHEVLRGSFEAGPAGLQIRIASNVSVPFKVCDVSGLPTQQAESQAMELMRACRNEPFDLAVPPLMRAMLVKMPAERDAVTRKQHPIWKLLLVLHHAVMDGWSMGVLTSELSIMYRSILAGLRKVPPLPLQYSDWAAWQSRFLASAEAQEQLQWWQQTLAGVPDLLALPTDRPRPAVQSFRGASYDFELPPDVAAAVAALNAATASSLYNTCLAAYKVVLSLYSGQHDIVVGSAHASRPPGTEGLIGYLVNTLPIRTTVSWDADVRHLLANERAALLDAMAHADVPFADVVAAVGIKRSSAYTPLVQATMTTVDLDWLPHLSLPGCTPAASGVLPADSAKFDILLTIYPKGTDVAVSFQYNTDLFDSSTIMAMSETFTAVLAAAADRPDAPLSQLTAVVEKTQRKHLLCDLQGAYHPEYLKSSLLHEAVTATAALDPGAPCLAFETSSMSYAEVEASANALALRLLATGLQPGARVGILLPRGLHLPVAMLAVLKAGGTYVPLDPYYPQDRLKYYVCAAGVSCIVADPMLVDRANDMVEAASQASAGGTRIALLQISHSEAVSAGLLEAVQPAVRVDPSSAAVIIFTSGSTGTPKGVMLSHRALMDFVQDWVARSKLGKADVGMLSSSICFDAHALQLWALLVAGGVCVVPRDEGHMDPKYIADLIAAHQITVNLFVTPQLGLEWLKHPAMKQNTGRVRLWGAGGELVPEQMLRLVDELFPGADNLIIYGPTETSVMVTCYAVPPSAPQGLLGQPTANSHLYVVFPGQPGSLVPIGAPGELLISGPGLADGYINLPDPAKTSFIDNPFYAEVSQFLPPALKPYYQRAYRTGDLVRWTSAGQLQFLGRIDRQVKVNGVRIELGEVEAALAGAPGVQGAVAKVVKDASGRASLVGYCLVAAEGVAAVQTHCRRVLLPTMVPSVILPLSEFPRLPNGKVNVNGLPEPDWAALAAGEEYQPPSNELEKELQELWMEELKIRIPISVTADWYRLGGTSLKAIALAAIIKQRYNLSTPASNFILLTTIVDQAHYVQQQLADGPGGDSRDNSDYIPFNAWPDDLRPPSAGQTQMYVLSKEGDNSHYNSTSLHCIKGRLQPDVLQHALDMITDRHEVLRGSFEAGPAGLQIRIATEVDVPFKVCDVSSLPSQQAETQAVELMRACRNEPFDLAVPPLMRAMLVKMPPERDVVTSEEHPVWKLLLVLHHAVMDGWSLELLAKELTALYGDLFRCQVPSLPPLPLQYSDWAAWQSKFLASAEAQEQLQWWKQSLAGAPDLLALPTDRPRPPVQSFRGASYDFELPPEVAAAVAALNAATGSSLYNTCLTAYKVVLSLYSGQHDIVVGSAHALRTKGTEPLIGYMVNTLPIRTGIDPQASFKQLLANERAALLDAMAHAAVPFADVVAALGVKRSSAYTPLIQAMMTTADSDWSWGLSLPGCVSEGGEELPEEHTLSDIALAVYPRSAATSVNLTYSTALFDSSTIEAMAAAFTAVLAAAAAKPDTPLSQLTGLVGGAQQRRLLGELQGKCHPEYLDQPLVVERFEQAAAQYPNMPCVVFEGQEMSYAAVNAAANALAHRLTAAGAGPGSAVGVMLARSFELVVSVVAIWKAGCVYVPMDPDYPEDRLAVYAQDSEASLVLVQPSHESKARSVMGGTDTAAKVQVLNGVEPSQQFAHSKVLTNGVGNLHSVEAADLAYCIFTSGSTGRPKGVQVSHGALTDLLAQYTPEYKAGPGMRALQVVSISFDPHVLDITATITSGGCLVLPRPGGHMEPAYIAELIKQERVTHVLTSVPSMSAHYMTAVGFYAEMRIWLMGGEPLSPELAVRMQKAFPNLNGPHNAYGPTEATICAASYCCPRPFEGPMVIGKPDHNMHCYVVDPTSLALLLPGAAGELLLSGPRLAAGYVGQPELTAKAFVPNPFFKSLLSKIPAALLPYYQRAYRTGDLVRWTSAGQLQFLGRIDRQVKVNGVRIELGEVEAALAGAPGVQGAVAKVVKDASGRASLVGYCLVAAEGVAAVQTHCRRVLLPTMVPSVIVALSEFPRLPNGKVDVDGLPEPDWAALAAGEEYQPPSNELEQELQELWMEELKISNPISITADWYRLGGTSLKAIALSAIIKQRYNLSTPASSLILLTTIVDQAHYVQQQLAAPESPAPGGDGSLVLVNQWPDNLRPPSAGQTQMYVLSKEGSNTHYNSSSLYCFKGVLQPGVLQQSLDIVTERHEVLRGGFEAGPAGLQIRIDSKVIVPFKVCDLSSLPPQQAESQAVGLMRACRNEPFDLAVPPLMRAMLVKMPPECDVVTGKEHPVWKLLLVLHHAVMDGYSMGVLSQELRVLYGDLLLRRPLSLSPLPLQYSDWAAWQSRFLASAEAQEQLQWWKQTLAGAPDLLALPTDRPRPPVQSFRGACYDFELPPEVAAAVAALNAATGSSMYNTCLAAYKVVLSLYSGQHDIVVGSAHALRPKETDALIGYMVNTLPIRTVIDAQASFKQLLANERAALLDAMVHAAVPFADVVAALGVKRSSAYTPLVQAMMTTADADWSWDLALPGCASVHCEDLQEDHTLSDIALAVLSRSDSTSMSLTYSRDLFDNTTIKGMAKTFTAVLAAAAAAPDAPLRQLTGLIGGSQQQRLLDELQEQCHPEYLDQPLVVERFEQAAAQYPNMPCVVFEGQEMSYAAVNAAANALAHRLTAAGAGPGSAVGVMLARSFELVVSVVAIWKAGCVYVPMDPDYPEDRLAVYAQDSKVSLVLVQTFYERKARSLIGASDFTADVLVLHDVDRATPSDYHSPVIDGVNSSYEPQPSDLAYCIFTSGSTGCPKGVQVSHGALRDLLAQYVPEYKAGPGMRALQVVSISFDPHVLDITATITSGGCLVLPRPGGHMEPAYIAELIKQERVTHVLTSVPSMSAHYMTAVGSYAEMRVWLMGGEPLSPELAIRMQKAFSNLNGPHNAYGPTEATICAASYCCPRPFEGAMVIGKPDHNMHCYVVDPTSLALLPPGAAGELLLSGPRLAAGYVGQPELTAKAFVPNPFFKSLVSKIPAALLPYYQRAYRTGDLVRWTSAGQLQFLGRIDRQVKVNGVRIELGEVEAALAGAPGVQGAVAKVVKDASGRASLVGYCLVAAEGVAAVQTHCRRVLLPTMVPSVIVALSEFPRLPNGKVDVDGLPEPDWAALAAGEEYQPPSNELEQELQELWMQELKIIDSISVSADWYRLGGTSLKAIALAAIIKQRYNLSASESNFILLTTILDQAYYVQQQLAAGPGFSEDTSSIPVNQWPDDLRPPSAGQTQMYVIRNEGDNSHYNGASTYRVIGALDATVVQEALNAIVARHEVLRGAFEAGPAGLHIRINNEVRVPFKVCDVSSLPPQQAESQAVELMRACRNEPFDLAVPPLMRAMLVKMPPESDAVTRKQQPVWKLLLVLHHAVVDGWSMGVLAKELNALYCDLFLHRPPSLPPLRLQYADWAAWQSKFLASAEAQEQLQWWKQTLAGVPDLLALPTDRPRPPVQTFNGAMLEFDLPQDVADAVFQLNTSTGSSLYNTCLTAYKVVLSMHSGQPDIVVGSAYALRPKGTEDLIGYLVNLIPIRSHISSKTSFKQLLEGERTALLGAMAHAAIPFADVVAALDIKRSRAYTPLVQASMTTAEMGWFPELKLPECKAAMAEGTDSDHSKSDIVLCVVPDGPKIKVLLEFNRDLFDKETVLAMSDTFTAVLAAAAAAPDTPLGQLEGLVAGSQRQRLLMGLQGECHPEYLDQPLVVERFEQAAAQYPNMPCVVFEGQEMSYAAVNAAANALAHRLTAAGAGPGSAVGVMLARSFELVVSVVAIWKAGCVYVPMDPDYPEDRLAVYAQDTSLHHVLVQSTLEAKASDVLGRAKQAVKLIVLDGLPSMSENPPQRATGSDVAYCIFTSGSTGRPKGVQVLHQSLAGVTVDSQKAFGAGLGMRALLVVSISFDPHVLDITATITSGGCLVLPRPGGHMEPAYIADLIREERVTHMLACVPCLSREYLAALGNYGYMRVWVMGGESWPLDLAHKMQLELPNVQLINAYGPTEATIAATYYTLPRPCAGPIVIGTPVGNMHAYVVEPGQTLLLPHGVPGELLLSGPSLAVGYVQQPKLTEAAFMPNPFWKEVCPELPPGLRPYYQRAYRTGDLVRWTSAGQLQFLGRIDRQVKVNGVRIELGEVEAALAGAPGVQGAVAKVVKDASGRASLVGYCLVAAEGVAAVQTHCRRVLLPTMVPSVIVALSEFPKLPNGKVDVDGLPEPDWTALAAGDAYRAPRSKLEQELQALWMQELKVSDPISVTADWYRLGGTSLKAIALSAIIKQRYNLSGAAADLILLTTIEDQARYLQQQLEAGPTPGAGDDSSSIPVNQWPDDLRPASAGQAQMYVICTAGDNSNYNEHSVYTIVGDLDSDLMLQVLNAVVHRHEVLRGAFETGPAGYQMRIASRVSVPFKVCDVSSVTLQQAETQALELLSACRNEPFDLAAPPLMRAMLVKMPAERDVITGKQHPVWKLLLVLHHAVMDGWSMGVLVKELNALYRDLSQHQPSSLPPLPLQYSDWAAWQSRFLASAEAQEQLQWWKQTLAGVPDLLALPTDRPRPAVQTFRGATHDFQLPPDVAAAVIALNAATGSSMYNTCLTAYKVVLSLYSGQQDMVVGTPNASRRRGTDDLIGYMVNVIAVRSSVAPEDSFRQLLANERQALLNAIAHADIPFATVVAALGIKRSSAYNPLVQATMTTTDQDWVPEVALPGCKPSRPTSLHTDDTKSELLLGLSHAGANVGFSLQYNTDLFDPSTMENMGNTIVAVLAAAANAPDTPVGELGQLVSQVQQQKLLVELQGQCHPEYLDQPLVVERFEQAAAQYPNMPCVVFEGQEMSYAAVNAAANALAHRLTAAGAGPGSAVGVMLARSFELVVSVIAVWKAGCVYVPMDPDYPEDRLAVYAQDTNASLVLVQEPHELRARSLIASSRVTADVLVLEDVDPSAPACHNMPAPDAVDSGSKVQSSDLAYCVFTSGSTGRPKGVQVSHGALRDLLAQYVPEYELGPGMRVLQVVSICFDPHVLDFTATITSGGCLVLPRPGGHMEPAYIAELIKKEQVTHAASVPSVSAHYLKALGSYKGLRVWVMGGEPLPPELAFQMQKAFPNLNGPHNAYGPTEATICAASYCCPRPFEGPMVIGKPDHNMHCYVVDPTSLALLPPGAAGELLLSGPRLAVGYVGQPELTAKAFVPNPFFKSLPPNLPAALLPYYQRAYRTGDLVRWTSAGRLQFLGRIDRQVKVNGVRIELGEVEAALLQCPGVTGAAAMGRVVESGIKSLVAFVTPATVDPIQAMASCRERLTSAMVPSRILPVGEFPLMPNGKVNQNALLASLDAGPVKVSARPVASRANTIAPQHSLTHSDSAIGQLPSAFEIHAASQPPPQPPVTDMGYVGPQDDIEAAIQNIWETYLQQPEGHISVEANFWHLGGTSLQAGLITSEIKRALGVNLQLVAFTENSTIRLLAAHVKQQVESSRAPQRPVSLRSWASTKEQQQPTLQQVLVRARARALRGYFNFPARTTDRLREKLYAIGISSWSFTFYAIVQFVLSTLMWFVVPGCFSVVSLGLLSVLARLQNATFFHVLPLLMATYPAALLLATLVLILLKWIIMGRMSPGAYPVHSWTYAKWVTMHALQEQIFPLLEPFIARTAAACWLLRSLGVRVGCGVMLDSINVHDWDLVEISEGATLERGSSVRASFIVPADASSGRVAVLVLSWTSLGRGCKLGISSNVPAGTHLADGQCVAPAMTAGQEGAIKEGGLPDTPHFLPESHQGWLANLLACVTVLLIQAITMGIGIGICLILAVLATGVLGHTVDNASIFLAVVESGMQQVIIFTLVVTLTSFKVVACLMACLTFAVTLLWKRLLLGSLSPGTCVVSSRYKLWTYSVWRRLLVLPGLTVWNMMLGNTAAGGLGLRLLGARLGKCTFSAGLECSEPEALQLGDYMSSGSSSHASCIDEDGVVHSVVVEKGVTLGNLSLLYPSSKLGKYCIIGSNTTIIQGEVVQPHSRRQGISRFGNVLLQESMSLTVMEEGRQQAPKDTSTTAAPHPAAAAQSGAFSWARAILVFFTKYLLLNTQVEVQSFALLAVWFGASAGFGSFYLGIALIPPLLLVAITASALWCRLLSHVLGCRSLWRAAGDAQSKASSHSVWSLRASMSTDVIAPMQMAIAKPYLGTPILNMFLRLMGMRIGKGVIFLGAIPAETPLFSLDDHVVIEAGGGIMGHFLAGQRFRYIPVKLGECAWIQGAATLQAGCTMEAGARVMPGANVLPGFCLHAGSTWDGIPAFCMLEAGLKSLELLDPGLKDVSTRRI